MRVTGYVRVSTEDQADSRAGLDAQRAAIVAEAERRGWELVEIIEDAGYSAKSLKRPGMRLALERMRDGRADVLVVSKVDRLSRSTLDFVGIMDTAAKEGWALLALDSPADMTTPHGEAMVSVQAVFAQLERRLIGQRTREALAAKKAQGVQLGRRSTLDTAVVGRIVSAHLAGGSLRAIADQLNADGVPTGQGGSIWRHSAVAAVLRSQADEVAS